MGFIYFNPNPKEKSVGDCTVRAISLFTNKDWFETFHRGSYENQNDGMPNMRGRSRTTGRYMSRDSGRSAHSIKDRAIAAIERMYDEAPTDHERTILDDIIRNIEMSER